VCLRVGTRARARARVHHGPAALGEPRVVEQRDDPRERRACAMREPLIEYPVSTREHPRVPHKGVPLSTP
jgi:hypothetical protein